jgi:hypothetical protein
MEILRLGFPLFEALLGETESSSICVGRLLEREMNIEV